MDTQQVTEMLQNLHDAQKAFHERQGGRVDELEITVNDYIKEKNRPFVGKSFDGGGNRRTWYDKDGNALPVIGHKEKLADLSAPPDGPVAGIGDCMAAMLGRKTSDLAVKALSEGSDTAGGYTVPVWTLRRWMDKLRAQSHVIRAGGQTLELEGPTKIARVLTSPTPSWRAENASVAESDPTFGAINLQPKSLATVIKVSRELIEDSANISEILEMTLAAAFAAEVDRVAMLGAGSGSEPTGIVNYDGVSTYNMGDVNGTAISSWRQIVTGQQVLAEADAPDPTAAIMSPRSFFNFAGLFSSADGQPLQKPVCMTGLPLYHTTKIGNAYDFGTAENASKIILGDFTQLIFGVRQSLQIQVLRETFAGNLQLGFLASLRADIGLAQPSAFAVCEGVIPAS